MKFGILKTKIEDLLIESYKNDTLKRDMFVFDELILKNKNLSKLYYLYEELSTNKGLSKELANELINQSITLYENLVNKISSENINEIKLWVGSQNTKNRYADLDNLFSKNVTDMINKVVSKNQIAESLMKNTEKPKPIIKASKLYGVEYSSLIFELGSRKLVAGQEDLILEVAQKLKNK